MQRIQRIADEAITRHLYRHKFRRWFQCFYCGEHADQRDHVLPVSIAANIDWSSDRTKDYYRSVLVTVPSCGECNSIAGNRVFASIFDKRRAIQADLRVRHAKTLKMPFWDEEDLAGMGPNLRSSIEASQWAIRTLYRRVTWPRLSRNPFYG